MLALGLQLAPAKILQSRGGTGKGNSRQFALSGGQEAEWREAAFGWRLV